MHKYGNDAKTGNHKMLTTKILLSSFIILWMNILSISQVKIGKIPALLNADAVVEIEHTTKGLLIPRIALTSTRVAAPLAAHVEGMNVYNSATIGDVSPGNYYNDGTKWVKVADEADVNRYNSTEAASQITNSSTTDVAISDMKISPESGTYLVMFDGQAGQLPAFTTAAGVADVDSIYAQLMRNSVPKTTHAAVFGNGEILKPGHYTVNGAISVLLSLTLDGGGDSTSLFIIEAMGSAAINTGATVAVNLINGAAANNIFWVGGAIGLGANTIMKGTLLSHAGAMGAGAGTNLVGRMFTSAGVITVNTVSAVLPSPSTSSYVNFRSLQNVILFSGAGSIGNTSLSTITGDIGTNSGGITGFEPPSTLNGIIYTSASTSTAAPAAKAIASFSIYQNGVLLANSTRTSTSIDAQISLQSMATILAGQAIDIRWKTDKGSLMMGNRKLTLINVK